ncbi:PAS domain-containing protein [Horticoccus luteus]|uniref:histidine kinase n=1 Tax=Horticoccus luteus TaxID=2862869 RepID=A0A8F9XKA8_9BACT|nr:PAS domain-containing protein [Horticoccus luteus]QYM78011.1 PAS domain-containing protein [Horticoccus luteus]
MVDAPLPPHELDRVAALRRCRLFAAPSDASFDDLARLAAALCDTTMAAVTFIDEQHLWFKARLGFTTSATPRDDSLCAHAIVAPGGLLVVADTSLDPRFAHHALVRGEPFIRFYAGCALFSPDGHALGTLCVFDSRPRDLTATQQQHLLRLARLASGHIAAHSTAPAAADQPPALQLFDHNPLPLWIYDRETLRFLTVNDAALARYGYRREEFLQRRITDIRPPEDAAALESAVRASNGFRASGRWRHCRRDGTLLHVDVFTHDVDFAGRPARLACSIDVTEQENTLAALRESEARFKLAARAVSDVLWDWDLRANTLWRSDGYQTAFGYPPEEIQPGLDSWSDRLHPEDRERVVQSLHAAIAHVESSWSAEYRFRRRDGSYAFIHDRGLVMRGADGHPVRMVGGMSDLTERKNLELQSLRAQRLESVGTLAGGIAHDLNNVLAPILMGLDLLRSFTPGEPECQRLITTIESSARRGASLVRQVLSYARGVEGERQPLDLTTSVQEIARIAEETFPRAVTIVTNLPARLPPILGDATQMHQVLLNLAVNARDAMPDGGTLTFTADRLDVAGPALLPGLNPGPHVRLRVSDTGTGIPAALHERIFEPFFTTKETGRGTGLGLSTVHAIVRSHGGTVHVESAPGHGSTFSVYLPVSPAAAEAHPDDTDLAAPRGRGETVLIVDDELSIRTVCQHTVEAFGYAAVTASDGAEAIARFATNPHAFHLVLTDMVMPGMDGPTAIRELLKLRPDLPIVAMTGLDSTKQGAVARQWVRDVLPKPFTADQLLRTLRRALDT